MEMLIISGLLGAGKTTLLLKLVRQLGKKFTNIAIIENEVGEIGIDGLYLESEGLYVQELYSGCICCTLSVDLLQTLEKLENVYKPDLVVLEPTGAARPGDIISTIKRSDRSIETVQVVSVIDAPRFKIFQEILEPLVNSHLEAAEVIVISKVDLVEEGMLEDVISEISSLSRKARIVPLSLTLEQDLNEVLEGWL